jgi:hypothetical protein
MKVKSVWIKEARICLMSGEIPQMNDVNIVRVGAYRKPPT